ncbi:MAG: ABC transporter permease [Cyanobacteriota bacterium]|nr:ABC transporter permease [Cyanobacteriota bacterium]
MIARWLPGSTLRIPLLTGLGILSVFILLSSLFLLAIGQSPLTIFSSMLEAAFGDDYAWSETLVKTTPILFCALAVALPAKLGLISVGGEGQLHLGALVGTGILLLWPDGPGWLLLPLVLLGGAVGGAIWGGIPGWLRARWTVNETLSTLMLNYVGMQWVRFVVYGPWKDPANLGWPATIQFPATAKLPFLAGSRVHGGLFIAVGMALLLYVLYRWSRWGLSLRIMQSNPPLAMQVGLKYPFHVLLVMALAGSLAGLAGITETAMIQGRLQVGISNGFGLSGFLVAWLAGNSLLGVIPMSLLIGGILAAGDALQLFAKLPSSVAIVLQGILFVSVLCVGSDASLLMLGNKHMGDKVR